MFCGNSLFCFYNFYIDLLISAEFAQYIVYFYAIHHKISNRRVCYAIFKQT